MSRWLLAGLALLAASVLGSASAATYNYRSDDFAWETAANVVSWDRSCTRFPGDDDKATVNFTGGFRFSFAGTSYTSVRILSNGALQFGGDTGFHRAFGNTVLPAGPGEARTGCVNTAPTNLLMAYWTDLNPSEPGSGNVTWELKGTAPNRRFVVSWNGVFQYRTSTPYAVQIVLFENGEFKYQYGNSNATGAQATIGVQVNSSDYTLYSFNSGYNANGSAIRWSLTNTDPVRLAEYRFNEYAYTGRVGEVRDNSGGGNHGIRVGAAANHPSGAICRGLEVPANGSEAVDGVDTLVNVAATLGRRGGFSLWWRYANAWSGSRAAMLLDASGRSSAPVFLQRDAGGVLRLRVTDSLGAGLTVLSPAQSFAAGTWVHLAGSWRLAPGSNQSVLRLFINGSLVGTSIGTTSGDLTPDAGSLFVGDARLGAAPSGGTANAAEGRIDELRLYNYDIGIGEVVTDRASTYACLPPMDHLRIEHPSGNGLTCEPSTLTLRACADASCSIPYVDGVSGSLSSSGSVAASWPDGQSFNIASGQSQTTLRVQWTAPGTQTLAATVPGAANPHQCRLGSSSSCGFVTALTALRLTVPNHVSESLASLRVAAIRASDGGRVCVPAFAGVSRSISFGCSYVNPSSGTQAVRLAGQALNASGSAAAACGSRVINASFDAAGEATLNLEYADVGQLGLTASYTGSTASGDSGLTMSGSTSFIAAPAQLRFNGLPSGEQTAGAAFAFSVDARNSAGATTPNFGREGETLTLSHQRRSPSGAGAVDGVFNAGSGSLAGGAFSYPAARWSEVGRIDLSATLADGDYLGSGLNASGSTGGAGGPGAVGPFRPHHLKLTASPACGVFSYAGQPIRVAVAARNLQQEITRNYADSLGTARSLDFSDAAALGLGALSPASWPASRFSAGEASGDIAYAFTTKTSGPGTVQLRATESGSGGVSSALLAGADASLALRSGRLQLQSATGSAARALNLPLRLEQWQGGSSGSWVLAKDDSCTLPVLLAGGVAATAQSGHVNASGAPSAWVATVQALSLSGSVGSLRLAPPGAAGGVDLALNLGATGSGSDRACLAPTRPASAPLNLPWLRSRQGSLHGCGAREDSDPSARASFSAIDLSQQKRVHERQID